MSKAIPTYEGLWYQSPDDVSYHNPNKKESSSSGGIFGAINNAIVDTGRALLDGIVSSIKPVLPGALSAANAALAQLSYNGSTGNFQSAQEDIVLSGKFQPIVAQYPEKIGSPLYQAAYLNTFSGFVKCQDAVFAATIATNIEEAAVEAFLNGGFFYE